MLSTIPLLLILAGAGDVPAPNDAAPSVPIDNRLVPPSPEPPHPDGPPMVAPVPRQVSPPESELTRLTKRWYGWQLVLADLPLVVLGRSALTGAGAQVATAGLLTIAPILHFAHGDWRRGIASAVARGLLVATASHYGINWDTSAQPSTCPPPDSEFCEDNLKQPLGPIWFGLASIGFLVLDDTLLSVRGDLLTPAPTPPASGRAFMPTLAPISGGLAMGLVGVF
jgi:hypothetical protein